MGGNYVVIDIGGGHFAFFAHLKTGSVAVKRGDRVKAGDVIGALGDTGNSDGPHLHFHVMDGPSPLSSNGIPYVFESFTGAGRLAGDSDRLNETGGPADIEFRLASRTPQGGAPARPRGYRFSRQIGGFAYIPPATARLMELMRTATDI